MTGKVLVVTRILLSKEKEETACLKAGWRKKGRAQGRFLDVVKEDVQSV